MSKLQFAPVAPATRRAKVLLIGEAGTGKTHAALTFPKPVMIDAEGSADWFSDRFAFSAVNTKSYTDVSDLLKQIRNGGVPCETVIIDSLTSIYNGLVNAATEARLAGPYPSDDLRPIDWGRIKRKFSTLLDELYHKLPVNVVCIGWIKPEYAKPGDIVNNQAVKQNDLVKVGEVFDGDRKTAYAFDFVFKIEGNDGRRTRATVIKTRSGLLQAGQVIPDFSWKTVAALLPKGAATATGMTDDEATASDARLFKDKGESAPAHSQGERVPTPVLIEMAKAAHVDLSRWLVDHIAPDLLSRERKVLTIEESIAARDALDTLAAVLPLTSETMAEEAMPVPPAAGGERIKPRTNGRLFALLDEAGIRHKAHRIEWAATQGVEVESFSTLSEAQAQALIRALEPPLPEVP